MDSWWLVISTLVGLALTVMWVWTMRATFRLREDVSEIQRRIGPMADCLRTMEFIANERRQWDLLDRRRAMRLKALLDGGVAEDTALATVDREMPLV